MVHSDRDEMYGAVHSMLELLTHLNKEHNVEPVLLVSKKGNVTKYCEKMGWEYYITGHTNFMMGAGTKKKVLIRNILLPLFFLRYKLKNIRALHIIQKYVNFEKIDLIHTNVNVCDIGAILAKKYSKPHFWHLREFGDLDYNRISFRKNYIQFMNNSTNKFFAISDAVKKHWISKGLDEKKVIRVYNGVEEVSYSQNDRNDNIINIVFSGSISKSKGQYLLIDALCELESTLVEKINVDIIGDGPQDYVDDLKTKVKKNGLEKCVNFLGYKSNVRELLNNYDIGMMCSKSEGFGRVTVEYMMAGLCVIASDTGANKELIKNEKTGLLFEYPDKKSLSNKLNLCIKDKKEIKKIGSNARDFAINNFTSNINAKNIFNNYCLEKNYE